VRKPRRSWKGNIETNLKELRFEREEKIHVTQNRRLRQARANMQTKIRSA